MYSPFVLRVLPPPCSKWAESGRGKPCSLAYWSNIMRMRIFRSDKMATVGISRTMVEAL